MARGIGGAPSETRFEPIFEGKDYLVQYAVWRETHQGYTRGDHYSGEGEYDYYIWRGWVTVRAAGTGELLAACLCGVSRERSFRDSGAMVQKLIEPPGLLSEMHEAYADFIGQRIIAFFKADRGRGVPYLELQAPEKKDLLAEGLILDEHGQRTLAFLETEGALKV